jgi:dTDP-4-amino-4,6-dideoxygalactose transaminase
VVDALTHAGRLAGGSRPGADQADAAGIIGDGETPPDGSIPLFKVAMSESAPDAAAEVLRSGYIGQGPKVEQFEARLTEILGHERLMTVNSATSGLHLALHLLRGETAGDGRPAIADGDEVLATPLTCTATNWPILANRLRIKWVDVDPANCNLDLDDLEAKITPSTRAIVLVHWGGYPVDLARLDAVLDRARDRFGFRPVVVEDCAHAWGSTYRDAPLGTHGNMGVFSFQAIKHLTSGDGGLLTVPDDSRYRRGKLLRWYGIDREGPRADFRCEADVAEYGFKFHMNDINAAIGIANLDIIDTVVARHRANAAYYDAALAGVDGVELLERATDRDSAFWLYTLAVDRRDDFARMMQGRGVAVSRVHERNDIHSTVAEFQTELPRLDTLVAKMICMPVGWWVTPEQRERVTDAIRSGW